MNKTEKTQDNSEFIQATAEQFLQVAKHAANLAHGLNTSYGAFVGRGTFYAYTLEEAQQAISSLEELIAHREMEILQAQEALEAYAKCVEEGGQVAHQIMRDTAIERMMRGEN